MGYSVIGELICLPFVLIILIYSYKGDIDYNLRFKMFHTIAWINLTSIVYNIVASTLYNKFQLSPQLLKIIPFGHYILMVLIAVSFFFYSVSAVHGSMKKFAPAWLIAMIPFLVFIVLLIRSGTTHICQVSTHANLFSCSCLTLSYLFF